MAFIKRSINITKEEGGVYKNSTSPLSLQNNTEKFNVKTKSYLEDAIDTLNILEKKGIDIYSDNRYGGMYLRGNYNSELKNIEKIFNSEDNIYANKQQENIDFDAIFS